MTKLASLTSFKDGDRRKVIHSGSRFEHWKRLFLGGFNSMFILNLVGLLGILPVILCGFYYFDSIWTTAATLPFASSIGTGIVTIVDTASIQHITSQSSYVTYMLMLMPLAIIFSSVLVSPFFHAMRNAEYDGVVSGYTKAIAGFKYNGLKFFVLGIITAVLYEIIAVLYYFRAEAVFNGATTFAGIAMLVGIVALAVVFAMIMVYAYVLTATYKMSIIGALKRSAVYTFTLFMQNVIIMVATLVPLVLMFFGSFMVSLMLTLYLFVGLSYMLSIWMVYIQTVLSISTPQSAKKTKKAN
ncbi:MAG: hypothetical protein R3Y18_04915 [Bacillota bacterium]